MLDPMTGVLKHARAWDLCLWHSYACALLCLCSSVDALEHKATELEHQSGVLNASSKLAFFTSKPHFPLATCKTPKLHKTSDHNKGKGLTYTN
jgi:hypothetical protein